MTVHNAGEVALKHAEVAPKENDLVLLDPVLRREQEQLHGLVTIETEVCFVVVVVGVSCCCDWWSYMLLPYSHMRHNCLSVLFAERHFDVVGRARGTHQESSCAHLYSTKECDAKRNQQHFRMANRIRYPRTMGESIDGLDIDVRH